MNNDEFSRRVQELTTPPTFELQRDAIIALVERYFLSNPENAKGVVHSKQHPTRRVFPREHVKDGTLPYCPKVYRGLRGRLVMSLYARDLAKWMQDPEFAEAYASAINEFAERGWAGIEARFGMIFGPAFEMERRQWKREARLRHLEKKRRRARSGR